MIAHRCPSLLGLLPALRIIQRKCSLTILISFLMVSLTGCGKSTENLLSEAHVLDSLERYEKAIVIYDKVLAKDPDNISALFDRSIDRGHLGDSVGELQDLKAILALDSTNTLALYNSGIAYGNLERYAESIDAFKKAMQTKGGEMMTLEFVPNAFVDEELYRYDVPTADIKLERGIVYYKADSVRNAYFDLTYCINKGHALKDSYYYRAMTYVKSGMNEHACKDAKMSLLYGMKEAGEIVEKYCK